jgi:predicted dehydrogenase
MPFIKTGSQVRIGVIGTGARSRLALRATGEAGGVIVAAADTDPAGRTRAHSRFGADVAVYDSHQELIAARVVDAAFVTTPDWTHAGIATDLLEAGIAVYLEKPLATTIEDCDALLAVAAKTGVPLYVGHNMRHSGMATTMQRIIQQGEIGDVLAVWCRHFVGNGGDYYFKDWHADRAKSTSLLLQKASHDIDIIHMLAGGYTNRVVGMGELMLYGDLTDRRERPGEIMSDWFSMDNWPPRAQTGLNPVVDVEDVSMMLMRLDNGVQASYQQCHFTPDYWRNYTVIGSEGRLENFGDSAGDIVRVWNKRHTFQAAGDAEYTIEGDEAGHSDADQITVSEFLSHITTGSPTRTSPIAARQSVAAGALAAESLRNGNRPYDVPPLAASIVEALEKQ